MKGICRTFAVYSLTFLASPVLSQGSASDLILHLPLDGNIVATGNLSGSTELIGPSGEPTADAGSALAYTDGQFGQAALFSGDWVVRIPLDLSLDVYPELTISAWIKPEGQPSGYILSTRNSQGPALNVSTSWAGMRGPGPQLGESGILRSGRWIFIAGVWNVNTGEMRFHYGRRSETAQINAEPKSSAMDVWVGGFDDSNNSRARNLVIDDVRVYARAMTSEEINQLASSNLTLAQEPIQVTSDFEVPELESDTDTDDSVAEPMSTGITNPVVEGLDADSTKTAADELEEARTAEYESDLSSNSVANDTDTKTANADAERKIIGWRLSTTDFYESGYVGGGTNSTAAFDRAVDTTHGGAMQSLGWKQRFGAPCRVIVIGSDGSGRREVGTCGPTPNTRYAELPAGAFTTGLFVDEANNGYVDSISLDGFYIDNFGERALSASDSMADSDYMGSDSDSDNVSGKVACRNGYLASGVRTFFLRRANDTTRILGFKLICRRIEKIYE